MPSSRPRRRVLIFASVALGLGGVATCWHSDADGTEMAGSLLPLSPSAALPGRASSLRPDPVPLPTLSLDLPLDVTATSDTPGSGSLEQDSNVFSWRTFIALNWPTLSDGSPDRAHVPGSHGDNPAVWESWTALAAGAAPGGLAPLPRDAPAAPPAALADGLVVPAGARILRQIDPAAGLLPGFEHPFAAGPLVDQNGRYVRFESLANRPLLDVLVARHHRDEQARESDEIQRLPPDPEIDVSAIQVQAVWKILSPAEAASGRFHAVPAIVRSPPAAAPARVEKTERATVGLVGLHIARKTAGAPGWLWSAFDHVDNYPTAGEPADRAAYNFYNKTTSNAPIASPQVSPARFRDAAAVEPVSRRPQVVRQVPVAATTRALNASYQAALRAVNPASVWQYYELVGTRRTPDPAASAPLPTP